MAVYTFKGTDAQGNKISGERVAESKAQVQHLLRRERITLKTVKEKGKEFSLPKLGSGRVAVKDIAIFFRQFSVMIDAGLPLVQCLEILAGNQENVTFQKTLNSVRQSVEGGSTLANAMRLHPKVFDDLTNNMIEAGEAGGILDTILQRLATYLEKIVKLKSAIKSALIYPISVISIASLILGALLKFVVPIFANMFSSMNVTLPLPTQIVIGLSNFIGRFWWVFLVAAIALFLGIRQVRKDPKGRYALDKFMLNMPLLGPVLRKIAVARFTQCGSGRGADEGA